MTQVHIAESGRTYPAAVSHIYEAIDSYVEHGYRPGSCTHAFLTNDLFDAVGRADDVTINYMRDICMYIYNEVPSNCWGSSEIVEKWIEEKTAARESDE